MRRWTRRGVSLVNDETAWGRAAEAQRFQLRVASIQSRYIADKHVITVV